MHRLQLFYFFENLMTVRPADAVSAPICIGLLYTHSYWAVAVGSEMGNGNAPT